MYCPNCGAMMDGDTCALCGSRASSGGAQGGGYGGDRQSYGGGYGGMPANPYAATPRQASGGYYDYFVPNLVLTILMCIGGPQGIFPLIGLIYSIGSRSARDVGDMATARSKAAVAKTMFWITIGLFVLLVALIAIGISTGKIDTVPRN